MSLVGLWAGRQRYVLIDPETSREYPIIIPGIELLDRNEIDEIILWQTEKTEKEIAQHKAKALPPLTEAKQHELGQILLEIRDSKTFRKENGHPRYW